MTMSGGNGAHDTVAELRLELKDSRDRNDYLVRELRIEQSRSKKAESQNALLVGALKIYAHCDGFCAKDECVCNTRPAKEALEKVK